MGATRDGLADGRGAVPPSGWRDMTRLARGDVEMGDRDRVDERAGQVAARIRDLVEVLEGWLAELERDGRARRRDAVAERLQHARERLDSTGR